MHEFGFYLSMIGNYDPKKGSSKIIPSQLHSVRLSHRQPTISTLSEGSYLWDHVKESHEKAVQMQLQFELD